MTPARGVVLGLAMAGALAVPFATLATGAQAATGTTTASTVVTGTVSSVDTTHAQLVIAPGPYLRAVADVPSGATLTRGGQRVALSSIRPGAVVTVHGYAKASDPNEVVVSSANFQSATFTPDLKGSVAGVDAAHRTLKVSSASGAKVVSVPVTAPVLAGREAFTLDGLQPRTGVSVAFVRDASGKVVHTSSGLPVARIVADAQSAY
jgi:hypothetical protein